MSQQSSKINHADFELQNPNFESATEFLQSESFVRVGPFEELPRLGDLIINLNSKLFDRHSNLIFRTLENQSRNRTFTTVLNLKLRFSSLDSELWILDSRN